jgi:hypothetical protein
MFLGGSYHDRDNPHKWGVSHGQLILFIRLVCIQKEGRQPSSRRRGLRTSALDETMMRTMMMMTIFYRGIGTKPTGTKNSNTTMVVDDDDDDVEDGATMMRTTRTDSNSKNNNNNKTHQRTIQGWNSGWKEDEGSTDGGLTPAGNQPRDSTGQHGRSGGQHDRWKQQTGEDEDDGDDGDTAACDWYTRQKNQPSLTKSMPLQQPTQQDMRSLAYDRDAQYETRSWETGDNTIY